MFATQKIQRIIGKYGCALDADEILLNTFTPSPNILTPL